jgi:hypothetical protein
MLNKKAATKIPALKLSQTRVTATKSLKESRTTALHGSPPRRGTSADRAS